jgi:long-chain fatty acid transport protein
MLRSFVPVAIIATLAFGSFLAAPRAAEAQCGALCLYELGTPDTARAAAGAGALAAGAATAWWNPAGMTQLEGTHVTIGTDLAFPDARFEADRGSTPGNDGGDFTEDLLVLPASYIVANPWDELRVGFSFNGILGGALDYDRNWVGRTEVTKVKLVTLNLQPAFAYPVTDWLSIGGGVNFTWFDFKFDVKSGPAPTDPLVRVRDSNDWAFSGNIALMLMPLEGTRIGIVYRTPVSAKLGGKLDNPTPMNFDFDTDLDFAQGINISLYQQLTETLALLMDVGWSQWSRFDQQPLQVAVVSGAIERNFKDTWRLAGGLRYQASEKLLLQSGISYDSSAVDDKDRLPDMPVDEAVRFGAGLEFAAAENISLHAGYEFAWLGKARFDNVALPGGAVIDGRFHSNMMHFASVGASLNF